MSFNKHHSAGKSDTWLTPPYVLLALGDFDLDPCCPPNMPWRTAARHFTKDDDGLLQPWNGRVWLNPPYGRNIEAWMRKLAGHGRGTALVFARTDTAWFVNCVWKRASGALFLHGRLSFWTTEGRPAAFNGGAPSVLVAYGDEDRQLLRTCGLAGTWWQP